MCRQNISTCAWSETYFLAQKIEYSAFLTCFNKAYLVSYMYFKPIKIKLVDPWAMGQQKTDQHVLQNTGCNGPQVTWFKQDITNVTK